MVIPNGNVFIDNSKMNINKLNNFSSFLLETAIDLLFSNLFNINKWGIFKLTVTFAANCTSIKKKLCRLVHKKCNMSLNFKCAKISFQSFNYTCVAIKNTYTTSFLCYKNEFSWAIKLYFWNTFRQADRKNIDFRPMFAL